MKRPYAVGFLYIIAFLMRYSTLEHHDPPALSNALSYSHSALHGAVDVSGLCIETVQERPKVSPEVVFVVLSCAIYNRPQQRWGVDDDDDDDYDIHIMLSHYSVIC